MGMLESLGVINCAVKVEGGRESHGSIGEKSMKHFTTHILNFLVACSDIGRCHRSNMSIGVNEEDTIVKVSEFFM